MSPKKLFLTSFIPVILLGSVTLYAQGELNEDIAFLIDNFEFQNKPIQVGNPFSSQDSKEYYNTTAEKTTGIDSLGIHLQDHSFARKVDSLWMNELYSSSRFEEIYGSVVNQNYEPVEYEELPTELLKERLEELNTRTPFNVEYNRILESIIKNFLKNRRKTMGKLIALSDYYFPMFEQELDRHDLPLELKYLAVVESALVPTAKSRSGAKGLWQFMYATGKIYDLEVNSYVDERADPTRATEAASKYLKSLYSSFNDWELAMAAYNSGPGNVSKAIRRSGGQRNFWKIRNKLPRETAGYVPIFLATMYIFEYAEEHGFKSNGPRYHQIATDTIQVKREISLEQVAKLVNLPIEEVEFLNPSYKLGVIPYIKDKNYAIRLPVEKIGIFVSNEEVIYSHVQKEINKKEKSQLKYAEQSNGIQYKVRSGDYLSKIARRYGVSVSEIKKWNDLNNDLLREGQRLTIYPRKSYVFNKKANIPKTKFKDDTKFYTVKHGDSLWSISQKFKGITVQEIKKWNDISGNDIRTGMKLKVSKG